MHTRQPSPILPHRCCDTPLLFLCSRKAKNCAPCRNCSVMPILRRPRSIASSLVQSVPQAFEQEPLTVGGPMTLYDQVMEAVASVQMRTTLKPAVALILGSGLGDLAAEIRDATAIPYAEIPHFVHSTVVGHAGR